VYILQKSKNNCITQSRGISNDMLILQEKEVSATLWQRPENSPSPRQSPRTRQGINLYLLICTEIFSQNVQPVL
jgi:hypothetical protein